MIMLWSDSFFGCIWWVKELSLDDYRRGYVAWVSTDICIGRTLKGFGTLTGCIVRIMIDTVLGLAEPTTSPKPECQDV